MRYQSAIINRFVAAAVVLLLSLPITAQNLVQNGSFEQQHFWGKLSYPDWYSRPPLANIQYADYWSSCASPNAFGDCGGNNLPDTFYPLSNMPITESYHSHSHPFLFDNSSRLFVNLANIDSAFHGTKMAVISLSQGGFYYHFNDSITENMSINSYMYSNLNTNYMTNILKQPLKEGIRYKIGFFATANNFIDTNNIPDTVKIERSVPNSGSYQFNWPLQEWNTYLTDGLGILLSTNQPVNYKPGIGTPEIPFNTHPPQFRISEPFMSKGEWIEYSWEFVAEDTFTHLTIGNFWKREQQNMIKWLFNFPCSIIRDSCIAYSDWEMYAFIDSVYLIALDSFSLTKDTAVCIGEKIELREAFGREITWILENGSEVVSDVLHLEITKAVEQIVGLWNGEYDTLYVFGKETPAYSIQHIDSLCKYTRNDFNRLQIHIEEQGVSAFWQINGTDQTGTEFASADTGYVYLTLTDSLGCIVRDTFYLEEYCPEFSDICGFPNAFSPNGDGLNDVLSINCVNISSAQISVLNRWGEILSVSENLGSAWDGTFDGKPCQAGVYTIIIQYYIFTQPDKKYIYRGTLNLLR